MAKVIVTVASESGLDYELSVDKYLNAALEY